MQENKANVIDFKTGKPLLPFQVRAILMAQFSLSKEQDHNSEVFVKQLEERLLTAGAATIVNAVQGFVKDIVAKR